MAHYRHNRDTFNTKRANENARGVMAKALPK